MKYLKKKNGLYYRPNACGYTSFVYAAGLFDEDECKYELANPNGEVEAIPVTEISEIQINEAREVMKGAQLILDAVNVETPLQPFLASN